MNLKRLLLIAGIVIILYLLVKNWSKIAGVFGGGSNGTGGADLSVYTASLNQQQALIDQLTAQLAEQNTMISGGNAGAIDEANKTKKLIQVSLLQQKAGVKFSKTLIDDLMKEDLATLISFNSMSKEQLLSLFNLNYGTSYPLG